MGGCLASLTGENLRLSSPCSCETLLSLHLTWEKRYILCVTTTFISLFLLLRVRLCRTQSTFTQCTGRPANVFPTSSTPPSVPQRWSMRWPAWTSHLSGRVAVSHRSALWDSGPTSLPVCSNCPVSQPCTRKCWEEVREKERLGAPMGRAVICGERLLDADNVKFISTA